MQSSPAITTTIRVVEQDLLRPTDRFTGMNVALIASRSLPMEYVDGELINLMSGIGVSPEYHKMVDEMKSGELILRDFATYCYMAGRLSIALAPQH